MVFTAGQKLTATQLNSIGRMVAQTTWTADSTTFTTSETMVQTLTFSAVSGVYYIVMVDSGWTNTTLGTVTWRVRAAAGASVTTAGSLKYSRKWRVHTAASFDAMQLTSQAFNDITPSGGQITVGLSGFNDAGTGKLEDDADNIGWMAVFAVGF